MSQLTHETTNGAPPVPPAKRMVRQYLRQLKALLPPHVNGDTWYAGVISALDKSAELSDAANRNPESLLYALFESARLGLPPGTDRYWLTPRPNKRAKGGKEVLGIVGYRGDIELIYNAGIVASVVVEVVRKTDQYRYHRGIDPMPVHIFDPWARHTDRGDVVGVYAYGIMKDGAVSRVVELNMDDIERAMRSSPTASSSFSPWKTDFPAMCLKTGVHRLRKFVPSSAELRYTGETMRATAEAVGAARGQAAVAAEQRQQLQGSSKVVPDGGGEADMPALNYRPNGEGGDDPAGEQGPDPDEFNPEQFRQPPAPEDDAPREAGPGDGPPADLDVPAPRGEQPAPAVELPTTFDPVAGRGDDEPATAAQTKAIGSILGREKLGDDDARFPIVSRLVARPNPIRSLNELSKPEASRVIELLGQMQDAGNRGEHLRAVLAAAQTPTPADDDTDDGGEVPPVGSRAFHDAGHPERAANGKLVTVPTLLNGDCGFCEEDAAGGGS